MSINLNQKKSKSENKLKEWFSPVSTKTSVLTVSEDFQMSTLEFPSGVIMSYYPADFIYRTPTPPNGWALCDGRNGTPDLRGRFILGYKNHEDNFGLGLGTDTKNIKVDNLPGHEHTVHARGGGQCNWINSGYRVGARQDMVIPSCPDGGTAISFKDNDVILTETSIDQLEVAQNNSPPYYVMVYIMKIV